MNYLIRAGTARVIELNARLPLRNTFAFAVRLSLRLLSTFIAYLAGCRLITMRIGLRSPLRESAARRLGDAASASFLLFFLSASTTRVTSVVSDRQIRYRGLSLA